MSRLPRIATMDLQQQAVAFNSDDWLYEIKYDGFRALAYVEDGNCQLTSRNEHDYTRFKDLMQSIADDLDVDDAILDGEIIVLDSDGKSRFYDLMFNRGTTTFAAFDILWLHGEDFRGLPLTKRKTILEPLVKDRSRILYVSYIENEGQALFEMICEMDMERVASVSRRSVP